MCRYTQIGADSCRLQDPGDQKSEPVCNAKNSFLVPIAADGCRRVEVLGGPIGTYREPAAAVTGSYRHHFSCAWRRDKPALAETRGKAGGTRCPTFCRRLQSAESLGKSVFGLDRSGWVRIARDRSGGKRVYPELSRAPDLRWPELSGPIPSCRCTAGARPGAGR